MNKETGTKSNTTMKKRVSKRRTTKSTQKEVGLKPK